MDFYNFGYQATLRAQTLSFFFFVIFIALLESVRLKKFSYRVVGWLLPILVIWANCHGGFIMGVLLLLLYGFGEAITQRHWKPLLQYGFPALLGCVLIGFLNPYGWEYWRFLFHAWTLNRAYIAEWSAIQLQATRFWPIQIFIAVTGVFLLGRWWYALRRKESVRPLITPVLVLLFLLAMAMRGVRFQTFLTYGVIAYAPLILSSGFLKTVLPGYLQEYWQRYSNAFQQLIPRLLLAGSLVVLCFLQSQKLLFQIPLGDELTQGNAWGHYPIGAVRYLRNSPYSGNLLIRFGHGEFAYWCLFPRFKVSMDGRYEEVYTQQQFLENYWSLQKDRTLQAGYAFRLINQSAADFILMDTKIPVTPLLLHSKQWQLLYQDPWFLIFGRKSSLKQFPEYKNPQTLTLKRMTIQDFVTPEDFQRFKL
jgi:hypothetical protein